MQIFQTEISDFPHAILHAEETRHCVKVLRHREGDEIFATEGDGNMYKAKIISFDKNGCQLKIIETYKNFGEHAYRISLAVSPLRLKDRFEWMMEKAVELGVTDVIPLRCQRTDTYKAKFKQNRIETILMTALKQSKRCRLPVLHELTDFESWIKQEHPGLNLMGWCETDAPLQDHSPQIKETDQINLLIGPEGDFTDDEVKMAQKAGFLPISLGENRLRTETAAIFGLSIIKFLKGY